MAKKEKQDLGGGWYRDEKGRLCYGDKCINLVLDEKKGIQIEADPACDVPVADELFKAGRRGTYLRERRSVTEREEPDAD